MRRRYLCHAIGHRRGPVCSWCGGQSADSLHALALAAEAAPLLGHKHPVVVGLRRLGGSS